MEGNFINKAYYDSLLSPVEIKDIESFAQNERLQNAVAKILLAVLYANGTFKRGETPNALQNGAFSFISRVPTASNDELANDLRAKWEGLSQLELGFQVISVYAPQKGKVVSKNNAV